MGSMDRALRSRRVGGGRAAACWSVLALGLVGLGGLPGCASSSKPAPPPAPELVSVRAPSPYRDLASVRAFEALHASMGRMKELVLSDAESEREASEGMRAILRVLAMSIDVTADTDPKMPHFARMDTWVRKVGGDNPDGEYDNVALDARHDYVIRGNVGSVRHVSFTVNAARGRDGRAGKLAYFNERTLRPDRSGAFELHLARRRPAGLADAPHVHWVDTSPGVAGILVRQYIGDREGERLATYAIDVTSRPPDAPIPYTTDGEIAKAIAGAAYGFEYMLTMHRTIMPQLWETPNTFRSFNSDDFGADISSSDNLYMFATFQIDPDEALVIETEPLDVRYWNLAIESRWHESVDYRFRRTHLTLDDAVVDPDGKLRFVLAHGRSPHPNWLETAGYREGFMTFRWVGERDSEAPTPKVIRVKRSELPRVLAERGAR